MAKLEILELRNPWTDCHKIWHGWLCRRYDPARQNSNRATLPPQCSFLLPRFLRPNRETEIYAVWFIGWQSRVIAFLEGWNYKKFPTPPIFTPKYPVNRHFQAWRSEYQNLILSKLLYRFKPNFAQWQRPQKYTSWVVQTGVAPVSYTHLTLPTILRV